MPLAEIADMRIKRLGMNAIIVTERRRKMTLEEAWKKNQKKSKFHNEKVVVNNLIFDSQHEYKRWCELKLMERAGEIIDLKRQVKYELIPAQEGERACNYIADFVYKDKKGNIIAEDAKGCRTKEYIIKRKMMLWRYGIRIAEV